MKNMKMKKAVGVLMAAMLTVSSAVPVLATNSTYGTTNYYDIDFENYTSGTDLPTFMTKTGYTAPDNASFKEVDDAVMGKVVKFYKGTKAYGGRINFNNRYTSDFVEGDKFFIELTMKVDKYVDQNTWLLFTGVGGGEACRLFRLMSNSNISFYGGSGVASKSYNMGEWMHLVFECAPGKDGGTVTSYMNGEKVRENVNATDCKLAYFNSDTWTGNRLEVNSGAEITVSKFRAWKSTESYDAAKAGDSVSSIASTDSAIKVDGDTITFDGDITVADLKQKVGATNAVALKADGTVAADSDMISTVKNVAVKSASGDAVKYYTVKDKNLYFGFDMADYTDGDVASFITGNLNGNALVALNQNGTLSAVEDTEKGHKVAQFVSGDGVWSGMTMTNNVFTKGVTDDDMVCMELSLKSDDYGTEKVATKIQFLGVNGGAAVNMFEIYKDDNGKTQIRFNLQDKQEIQAGKWYKVKIAMIPKTNTVKCYLNDEEVSVWTNDKCSLAYLNGETVWAFNKLLIPQSKTVLVDAFKAWKAEAPAVPVDPTEPSFAVDGSTVTADVSMLADTEKPVLYVAAYDKDGRITEIKSDSTLDANGNLSVALGDKAEYKAFLWDSKTLTPYIDSTTYAKGEDGVWAAK